MYRSLTGRPGSCLRVVPTEFEILGPMLGTAKASPRWFTENQLFQGFQTLTSGLICQT